MTIETGCFAGDVWTRSRRRAGAFPHAEGMMDESGVYVGDRVHTLSWVCSRAELWAAIEAAWYEAYAWGLAGGSATDDLETDAPALVRAARQDVRALLGMEPE